MKWQIRKVSKHDPIVNFILEDKKEEEKKDGKDGEKKENDEEVEGPEDENVEFLGKAPKKKETRVTYFRKYLQPNIIIYLRSPIAKTKQKVYKSRERRLRITVTVPGQNIEYRNRK